MNHAERAARLLQDEYFTEQMDTLERLYLSQMSNSDETDVDGRERAYLKLRALKEIRAHFEAQAQQTLIDKRRWKIF